jgi:hypothetical protein
MLNQTTISAYDTAHFGYSTTHLFYGQQPYFTLARWQEADGFHECRKCNGLQIGGEGVRG